MAVTDEMGRAVSGHDLAVSCSIQMFTIFNMGY